ncbi:MAG: helix-turn-helix transcriptional regulator [Bradyrhizobium sp.]|nr:helix-turn-helix transcriptional regulator [Bradyrhizobium sp.]
MTGQELKKLREDLGEAIGQPLTVADMAKLCGLPDADGAITIRKWEVTGPTGPVAELLRILAMASDRYPILEMFNVFDRHDVPAKDRPARRQAFREQMRSDVRRRIG